MTESDDEVVNEVDVYLSKTLAKNLYLFQYPVRPSTKPYDDVKCLQARIKPKQQKVELELGVNVRCPNYDRSKGEQIAQNVDGSRDNSGNAHFNSSLMDKQVLSSTKAVVSSSRYVVGLLRPGELHLTPLHALVQLRPSFSYLDKSDALVSKLESHVNADTGDDGMQEEEEVQTVHVKFAGTETERSKAAKERSYNYLQQQMASEPWQPATFHPSGGQLSSIESAYLYCSKMDHDASDLPGTIDDYLHSLLPNSLTIASGVGDSSLPSCLTRLQNLALPDQVKTVLMSANVVQFSQLMEILPPKTDATHVLRALQQIAMLVQGCWVIKSEILYPKEMAQTSVNVETLCRARDYIMWQFTQSKVLVRLELIKLVKLSKDIVTELLSQMGRHVPTSGWEFVFPTDKDFISKYPEVVQRQQLLWDARQQQIVRVLQQNATKGADSVAPHHPPRQRQRQKSLRESQSEEEEDASRLGKSPQRAKRKSGPRGHHVATLEISPTQMDFTPSPELKYALVQFTSEELKVRHCLTLTEAKRLLMLKLSESPPGHVLSTGVSDKMIEETILEMGAQQLQNKWPQNTTPEPLFAFLKLGDYQDKFREALIDLFTKTARIRISTFQKKVEDELGESLAENVCRRLLQEYCITKSGYYYLKGTVTSES